MLQTVSLELVAVVVLRSFSGFGEDYLSAYIGQHITLDIRSELNRKLQRMPLSFFNRTPSGMMMSRVVNDVGVISSGITDGAFSVVGEGARLIAVLGAAFWIDWKLALIAFVVFPCAVGPVMAFSRRMRKLTNKAQKQMSGITSLLQEAYQGNRVVKAFGMEEYERERFDVELRRLFKFSMRAAVIKASTGPMIEAMAAIAFLIALWYGTASVIHGTRSIGTFGAFLVAMLIVYEPFKRLARINNTVQQSLGAAERVFDMMDQPVEIHDDPAAIALGPGNHSIRMEHVSFRYAKEWVLRDINLEIPAGKVVALVGMSGGGKSTLADLIPRFHDVQEGRITVDGINVKEHPARIAARANRHRHAAYVPVQRYDSRQHRIRQPRENRRRKSSRRRPRPTRTTSSRSCPRATTRWSAKWACGCRAASANASRSRARCSRTRRS